MNEIKVRITRQLCLADLVIHCFWWVLFSSIVMTISSTVLALVLMPLCLWMYSRAWINTPVVNLLPFGAIILTLCSTLIPIGLGVWLRQRYARVAEIIIKVTTKKKKKKPVQLSNSGSRYRATVARIC